jgi:hypothetical protein
MYMEALLFIYILLSTLLISAVLAACSAVLIYRRAMVSQRERDANRTAYIIEFPAKMSLDNALSWLRTIGNGLDNGLGAFKSRPTMVFELRSKNYHLEHRIRFPDGGLTADLIKQLHNSIDGVNVTPVPKEDPIQWTYGIQIDMVDNTRPLRMADIAQHSNKILTSAGSLDDGEQAIISLVVSHTSTTKLPPAQGPLKTSRNSILEGLLGRNEASNEERQERRAKLAEPAFKAICRVAAVASTEHEAKRIVQGIEHMMRSENSGQLKTKKKSPEEITYLVNAGATPAQFRARFSISELLGLSGWPIDGPRTPGLPSGSARQFAPDVAIATDELLSIGMATFRGKERRLTLGIHNAMRHMYIPGGSGVGKTTLMTNIFHQAVRAGHGAIIFDAKKDIARDALKHIPPNRLDDVVYLDFTDREHPIGFNPLDQGRPLAVADEIVELLQFTYSDARGVYMRPQIYYGLRALGEASEQGDRTYTLMDLLPLLAPTNDDEEAWSRGLVKSLKDQRVKNWFNRSWTNLSDDKRQKRLEPLIDRWWQFERPEMRNILGQSTSAFQMDDVIRDNKILIVNLVGLTQTAKQFAGLLLFKSLWASVQSIRPDKENLLFLDEFKDIISIPVDYEEMLAKARSQNLGMILAHQNLGQIKPELQSAIMGNTATKIVFEMDAKDSRNLAAEFGSDKLDANDFKNLKKYQAIARINTDTKPSEPVTLRTLEPFAEYGGMSFAIINRSRGLAKSPAQVDAEEVSRRMPMEPKTARRPQGVLRREDL